MRLCEVSPFVKCILQGGSAVSLLWVHAVIAAPQEITISAWGGALEEAQRQAMFIPFEKKTGIRIHTQRQQGGLDMLTGDNVPDLVDMERADGQLACDKALVHRLDFEAMLATEASHRSIEDDFLPQAFFPCGVTHLTFSTQVAFDSSAYPDEKPSAIADFFDLNRFPGKRGLRKSPGTILEWALLAEGVPISQIYDLLSTERGLRLAFKRLERLRGNIVWWDKPEQPGELLASGQVSMTSGFNGRFFGDQLSNKTLSLLWDGQIIDRSVWVIPSAVEPLPAVKQFIRFATQPRQMARLSERIPYGPTRYSALKYIGNHPTEGIPMTSRLPNHPHHLKRSLFRDTRWYARTNKLRQQAFNQWLNAKGR